MLEAVIVSEHLSVTPKQTPLPLRLERGLTHLPVTLPDYTCHNVILDTGLQREMAIAPETLARLSSQGHVKKADREILYSVFGPTSSQLYIVRWIDIGGVRFTDVPVVEARNSYLGVGVLRRVRCVFDFPNRVGWLIPDECQQPLICAPDASGLVVAFVPENRAFIRRLRQGYPGGAAGISANDELLAIDDTPVQKLSIHTINEKFSQAGETVHLTLKSGDREYEVDLKLDRPFEYPPKWEPEDPDAAPRPFPKLDDRPAKD